jgi:IclR family pca regulon transcriptional regulator
MTEDMYGTQGKKNFSTSIARGLAILASFSSTTPELGITQISKLLGINKSTVHRYVNTLKELGYLEQDAKTSRYRLGIKVLDLGLAVLGSMEIRTIALPFLEELATTYGHTVNISVLDGNEVVFIERVRTRRLIDLDLHVGSRLPAYCTDMGKVLLAHLPAEQLNRTLDRTELKPMGPNTITDRGLLIAELCRVKEQGFALNNEELAYGLRGVAVAIQTDRSVAALGMALHATSISLDGIKETLVPPLMAAADGISARLWSR